MENSKTLFERVGGMKTVDAAIDIFYARVLADNRINHFFMDTHMATQISKQKAFLAYILGAPSKYTGKSMKEAHAHINLNEDHFDAIVGHLINTLRRLNIASDVIGDIASHVIPTKGEIIKDHSYLSTES